MINGVTSRVKADGPVNGLDGRWNILWRSFARSIGAR